MRTSVEPSRVRNVLPSFVIVIVLLLSVARGVGATNLVSNTADAGAGSLRDTISSSAPGDTIVFDGGLGGQTIHLTSGQLAISNNLTIDASALPGGIIIDGVATFRVLQVFAGSVSISSLTLTNGLATNGAGVYVNSNATFVAANCAIGGHSGGIGGFGGGIFNQGTLVLNNCSLSQNFCYYGGGIANFGAAVTLNNCILATNSGFNYGGAIYSPLDSSITLANCSFYGNSGGYGGAILNQSTLTAQNCTFSGNFVGQRGGAIYHSLSAPMILNNCTVYQNYCQGFGAGIYTDGPVTCNNCTIFGNIASNGGIGGGIYSDSFGIPQLTNTIVAGNSANVSSDIYGTYSGANNFVGGNPLLRPFGFYGGSLQTVPPLAGSPVIDAGINSVTSFLATDERGYPRQIGPKVDIGAAEHQYAFVVANTSDSGPGSLRGALAQMDPGAIITFTNSLSGQTIHLTSGQLAVSADVTLDASSLPGGIAIDGNANSRVLEITAGTVTLNRLTLTNAYVSIDNGGGILVDVGATLMATNCTVCNNVADYGGGGICNNGTARLDNCTVSGNSGFGNGGGIVNGGGGGPLTLNNCTIAGNSGESGAGLTLYPPAPANIMNCTVYGNMGDPFHGVGGGILDDAALSITNTIVASNTASFGENIFYGSTFSGNNNFTNGDPMLAPLGNYGGPTQTMPPLPGSPVIDAGTDAILSSLTYDQRGNPRFMGFHVDIGAAEFLANIVVTTNDSGPGSLRYASAFPGPSNVVTFDSSLTSRAIQLTSGPVILTNAITLDGSSLFGGAIIDGAGKSHVLELTNGANVTLRLITVTNGFETNGLGAGGVMVELGTTLNAWNCTFSGNTAGGYLGLGGGLCIDGTATLNNCIISGNSAISAGGLLNDYGTLTMSNCIVTGNSCSFPGGAGIRTQGTTAIYGSVISSNSCNGSGGGGLYVNDGTTTLNNSALLGNFGYSAGGLINVANLLVSNCTFSGNNSSFGNGGAILNSGLLTLASSTLAGNFSSYAGGGGICNFGTNTLINCTLAGNSAGYPGGGAIYNSDGALTLIACTVYGNTGVDVGGIYNQSAQAVKWTNTISSANSDTNFYGAFSGASNFTNNPHLHALGNYGGPTQTMPPMAGSPVIDAGFDVPVVFLTTDQRGYPRLSGAHMDIGAAEARATTNQIVLRNASWTRVGSTNLFQFTFTNASGRDFTALSSTNLTLPLSNWTAVEAVSERVPGQYWFRDPQANSARCFYRVVSP